MMPADLAGHWRSRAAELERYAAPAAEAFRTAACELEAALREADDAELTLADAAQESGYSTRRIAQLVADGSIENRGRKGAPRIRRADLPRRTGKGKSATYDPTNDARALVARMRA